MTSCLSLLCFLVFGPPTLALGDGTSTAVQAPRTSIQAYGRANACAGWTDGCIVCAGATGQTASCSTPGIACIPGPIVCTVKSGP